MENFEYSVCVCVCVCVCVRVCVCVCSDRRNVGEDALVLITRAWQ
jgi:hypothetical protein